MIYFFTKAQFENRISAKKVKRLYDDNSDGNADTDPVNQLRADASSKVLSYLEPMGIVPGLTLLCNGSTGELLPSAVFPSEIVRLSLDVAVALACQRHPEVMRQDWTILMKQCDADLCKLRDGKTSLGGAPHETVLHGGVVGIPGEEPQAVSRITDTFRSGGKWGDTGDFG